MPAVNGYGQRTPTDGGEQLRAVLDDAAIYSDYAFYNILFPVSSQSFQATQKPFRGAFQCKADCWFLMTAMYGAGPRGNPSAETETWNLIAQATSKSILNNQPPKLFAMLFNQNFSSRAMLPDYKLFAPADMITVELTAGVNFFNAAQDTNLQDFACLTLEGIEYRFRS